jgi:hypothetical protein
VNRFIVKLTERSLPFFSVLQGSMRVVGARATKSLQWCEAIPLALAHVVKSRAGSASHIVHLRHTFSSERSSSHGKRAIPGLFRIGCSSWVQKVLLWSREDLLHGNYVLKEAPALFRGSPHKSPDKAVITWQLWMNCKWVTKLSEYVIDFERCSVIKS